MEENTLKVKAGDEETMKAAAKEMYEALLYVRDTIEAGHDVGMGVVLSAIRAAEGRIY
ncbi:MAG: hypothetical protein U0411_13495 [Thermodesulfovibrionales bacterium]